MVLPLDFAERMQIPGSWLSEDLVPGLRAKTHYAGEAPLKIPKAHGAQKSRQAVATECPNGFAMLGFWP
jgi:hypothetical protein